MGRAKLFFLGLRREINLFGTNLKYILLINIPIKLKFYGVKTKITHEVPLPCLGMCKIRQISQKGFVLQTISVNETLSKLFPVWCHFLRKSYTNRRKHWRVRAEGDTWHWSRQYHQRFELHGTRQWDWRVEQVGNCQLY